jgi:hypothetical protein
MCAYDLRSWVLWSGHRAGAVAGRQGKASRKGARTPGSRSVAMGSVPAPMSLLRTALAATAGS